MKILFLSKRAYTNKDLLAERYGRIYEFSRYLAGLNHRVYGIALDYRRGEQFDGWKQEAGNPDWRSYPLFPRPIAGLNHYLRAVRRLILEISPDVLVSVSDVYHVILGDWLARQYGILHIADLYDDYECFGAARFPGVIWRYRKALSRADGVVCVSNSLKRYVMYTARPANKPQVILNAVDKGQFRPLDKYACRDHFDLPRHTILVGLGGAISKSRGVQILLDAYRKVFEQRSDIHLVLAGPILGSMQIPNRENIRYLGELAYDEMPAFYNSLDVGLITNIKSRFAEYCFPQKFFEMRACNLPVVVPAIGDVKESMMQCSQGLYAPGNTDELARAIVSQVNDCCLADIAVPDWNLQGKILANYLEKLHAGHAE
jgi:teichuronic acid biosynthesis glycosyltransferase TuaC